MNPSEELRSSALIMWNKLHDHAFVNGLANGTLPEESFRYFVGQDYKFLTEYARSLAFCVTKAPDITAMRYFSELLKTTLTEEMAMYESYAENLGLSRAELAKELDPASSGYAEFLVDTASRGSFVESLAALLPCVWSYVEIGQDLVARGLTGTGKYSGWIEAYAAPELAAIAESFRDMVNIHLSGSNEEEWAKARDAFSRSTRFELAVWDAALTCGVPK